jgi:transglycosylase-like protein with SLT domain
MPRTFSKDVESAISLAADRYGLDPEWLRTIAKAESGGNPKAHTGSYAGLFQLSPSEFERVGGRGDIFDPKENANAAASLLRSHANSFEKEFGRPPSVDEIYMIHQQGWGGFKAHMQNPDRPAWENMARTKEGRARGEEWAKKAVRGNLTPEAKRQYGEDLTSGEFIQAWKDRLDRLSGKAPEASTIETPLPQLPTLSQEPTARELVRGMRPQLPGPEMRQAEPTVGDYLADVIQQATGTRRDWAQRAAAPPGVVGESLRESGRTMARPFFEPTAANIGAAGLETAMALPPARIGKAGDWVSSFLEKLRQIPAEIPTGRGGPRAVSQPSTGAPRLARTPHAILGELGEKWQKATVMNDKGEVLFSPSGSGNLAVRVMPDGSYKKGFIVYHGSPHDFERFSLSRIGTGEGAQAYGYGLYFAENEKVAKSYKDALGKAVKIGGELADGLNNPVHRAALILDYYGGNAKGALKDLENQAQTMHEGLRAHAEKAAELIRSGVPLPKVTRGHMYKVKIQGDPEDFMDWDKPLAGQPKKIQEAFRQVFDKLKETNPYYETLSLGDPDYFAKVILRDAGGDRKKALEMAKRRLAGHNPTFSRLDERYREAIKTLESDRKLSLDPLDWLFQTKASSAYSRLSTHVKPAEASKLLKEAGIPGIKYWDQLSRRREGGTRNFVTFNDTTVEVLQKYGLIPFLAAPALAGAMSNKEESEPRS